MATKLYEATLKSAKVLDCSQRLGDKRGVLFDNLITLDELLLLLKNQYKRRTIYKWISEGMPHRKIRGKLWFDKDDALFWLTERS